MPKFDLYRAKILNPLENGEIEFFYDGYLIVDKKGKIVECDDFELFEDDLNNFNVNNFSDFLIIPGMIDSHTHILQYDEIGTGSGQLLDWLNNYIFPLEARFDDFLFSYHKAKSFFEKLLKNGTTTVFVYSSIHYNSTSAVFEAAADAGINVFIGNSMGNEPNSSGLQYSTEENILISEKLLKKFHKSAHGQLEFVVTPRYAGNCSFDLLKRAGDFAKANDLYIQTHIAENGGELDYIKKKFPDFKNYTDIYDKAGLIGEKTILAHGIYLKDEEINIIKNSGAIIAHCPNSNRYLSSGVMPLDNYQKKDLKITLGTDIAGGFYKSIIEEAKEAVESSKTYKMFIDYNSEIVNPNQAFKLSNIEAAKSLGISSKCGNLEKGKNADFLIIDNIDFNYKDTIERIIAKLIYTSSKSEIKHTFINGIKMF